MTRENVAPLTLADLLSQHREREWYFVRPGGNLGDELIYAGAECLANQLGLRRQYFDAASFAATPIPTGTAIYLHGGGGLNPWGSGRALKNLILALGVRDALVVQGPQTCEVETSHVAAALKTAFATVSAKDVHFYVREQASANYLSEVLPQHIHLHLDHDTALHLSQADLLSLGGLNARPRGRYVLFVNRSDNEAPQHAGRRYKNVVEMDPAYYCGSLGHWIRVHAYASRIITNRLHSAIGGSLLGVPVLLTGGSYHKNHSVWDYSLRAQGVEWRQSFDDELTIDSSRPILPRCLSRSWKVQRLMMRLRGVPV